MKAVRIQRQRTRGWRMPKGAIYVGRPSAWGNPFKVECFGLNLALALYRRSMTGCWTPDGIPEELIHLAYQGHQAVRAFSYHEVRGKDLACWCPLDQPCHADILLELANQ